MSAKKTVAKKATPKKVVKAEKIPKAPKEKKEAKPKAAKKVSSVQLVTFEMGAVIPTQQYGNFQPRVVVTAKTLEEARAVVMPFMEDLYKTYAELPLNGRDPKFYGNVTVTEKVVDVKAPAPKAEPEATVSSPAPSAPSSSESTPAPAEPAPVTTGATAPTGPSVQRSEPYMKAHKAITLASSHDALDVIKAQIEKSVKIAPEDKPELLDILATRKNEIPF